MLQVLLAQLPVPGSPALNTPLAAGYLKAYAEAQGLAGRVQITILPRYIADHAGDAALVAAIADRAPDLLGLSLYTWNSERSLEVVRRVRRRLPGLAVLVGGPEVQADNPWVLGHPAVDMAVIGEGEQAFADLLAWLAAGGSGFPAHIPGLAGRGLRHSALAELRFSPPRAPLPDLSALPSPYLTGQLEPPAAGLQLVEISRWCPYPCSFCLYGRNMGPRLGGRAFSLERVLAEIAWGRTHGVRQVHVVEANLNLLPIFRSLMQALARLNADQSQSFYAELRAEHLTDEAVALLVAANVRVVEVGLQTANPHALVAVRRRTDLARWAAGVRRLRAAGIEILLDVILGLPADDQAGVAATLSFIEREVPGPYDAFLLQVLPGTALRHEAARYQLRYQDRPPYYVLATDHLSYPQLRQLRRQLKHEAGLDPDGDDGLPSPRADALAARDDGQDGFTSRLYFRDGQAAGTDIAPTQLAAHVDLILAAEQLNQVALSLADWLEASPSSVYDLYLVVAGDPPTAAELQSWRDALPYAPGYLDRVAAYANPTSAPGHRRAGLRIWLVLPWVCQADPADYRGVAELIWRYRLTPGEALPLGAWRTAGGAGIALAGANPNDLVAAQAWAADHGRLIWPLSG
ncbi:MAG: B12-binding domain-containing radical SAM protein [Oscillochloris sp.]|nr:B12-binding domain-containing radical SAM protein [Oscillochloris sp.]